MSKATTAVVVACLLAAFCPAFAGAGKVWKTSGSATFSKGKLEGVSVLSSGEMKLAPTLGKIKGLRASYVWDLQIADDDTLYVGTGSPAAVYRVREGKVELLHKTSEKHVLSVLPMPDGSVLAATAPRGIIYRIDAQKTVTVLADLEEAYVWDMARRTGGEVLCATGPKGKLIELNAAGETKEILDTPETHLVSLALNAEGHIFFGTSPKGLVYQVDPKGQATIIYDARESEVHCLLVGPDGAVYAGTAQKGGRRISAGTPPRPRPGSTVAVGASKAKSSGSNSVYRIEPGEGAVRLAELKGMSALSLARTESGEILVGTGSGGRLLAIQPDAISRVVTQFEAKQIYAMAAGDAGSMYVSTSNSGGLWRLESGHRNSGTFTSDVFDAGYLSRWGRVWWKGNVPDVAGVKVSLRTGNTSKPDKTWSKWSGEASEATGIAAEVPAGRFAQVRAVLTTTSAEATPTLVEIDASYRQVNRRPLIKKLMVGSGPKGAKAPARPPAAAKPKTTKKTIVWEATDPNGDELIYDLFYRAIDEQEWKELKKDIRKTSKYDWNADRVPDGHYLLRLVASDRLAYPEGEALTREKISRPFLIDNRRPQIVGLEAMRNPDGSYLITGVARDAYSNISKIQVSRNSGEWKPVFPSDGILDSTEEKFSYRTEVLDEGERVFVFAAADENYNIGSDKIVLTVR